MTPDEIATSLDVASLTHQIAMSAAVQELLTLPAGDPRAAALKIAMGTAYGRMATIPAPRSNVIPLPVKQATRWTVIKTLDGAHWASSHDFGVTGAWSWIVDTVAAELEMSETEADERIASLEGSEDQFDGDDLVTVDGLPVYRIEHTRTPFQNNR